MLYIYNNMINIKYKLIFNIINPMLYISVCLCVYINIYIYIYIYIYICIYLPVYHMRMHV